MPSRCNRNGLVRHSGALLTDLAVDLDDLAGSGTEPEAHPVKRQGKAS